MPNTKPDYMITAGTYKKAKQQIQTFWHDEEPEKMKKSQYKIIRGSSYCAIRRNY